MCGSGGFEVGVFLDYFDKDKLILVTNYFYY